MSADNVLERLKRREDGGTHWEDCDKSHDNCAAIKLIERQARQIEALNLEVYFLSDSESYAEQRIAEIEKL